MLQKDFFPSSRLIKKIFYAKRFPRFNAHFCFASEEPLTNALFLGKGGRDLIGLATHDRTDRLWLFHMLLVNADHGIFFTDIHTKIQAHILLFHKCLLYCRK